MSRSVTVIVAAHKEYRMPDDPLYLPLQVGAAGKEGIGYARDDTGENISVLNPYFCELTGLYWAWKNLPDDYIGLAHYRRHFSSGRGRDAWEKVLRKRDLEPELGKIRVFVPGKRRYWIETLYSHYAHTHHAFQLDETRRIVGEKDPGYLPCFDRTMRQRWGYMFNMMILRRDLLDAYCTWLFDILFTLRERLGEEGLTPFHSRYYGRVSEILLNVWLNRQLEDGTVRKDEIREIPLVYMEKVNWRKKGTAFLKAKFFGKRYEGSF